MEKYIIDCRNDLLLKSREIALEQVGVKEHGQNCGREIAMYLKSIGLKEGNPYCAAGQYFCFYMACLELNLPLTEIPFPKTGLALGIWAHAKKHGIKTIYKAAIDDLIVWRRVKSSYRGHVERVVKVFDNDYILTVGFNTADAGGRDGVNYEKRNIMNRIGQLEPVGLIGFKAI